MNHVNEGLLAAYVDGAFDAGGSTLCHIEQHLAECLTCRDTVRKLEDVAREADVILGHLNQVGEPAGIPEAVGDRSRPIRRRAVLSYQLLSWAATLFIAALIGWLAHDLSLDGRPVNPPQIIAENEIDVLRKAPEVPAIDKSTIQKPAVISPAGTNSEAESLILPHEAALSRVSLRPLERLTTSSAAMTKSDVLYTLPLPPPLAGEYWETHVPVSAAHHAVLASFASAHRNVPDRHLPTVHRPDRGRKVGPPTRPRPGRLASNISDGNGTVGWKSVRLKSVLRRTGIRVYSLDLAPIEETSLLDRPDGWTVRTIQTLPGGRTMEMLLWRDSNVNREKGESFVIGREESGRGIVVQLDTLGTMALLRADVNVQILVYLAGQLRPID